ncbi:MAG: hypothetical protein HY698_06755 [Deltaproteobacteria bacterium]|nr:hypothetical protein [Deltaproteobacteria bacterium]
MTRWTIVAFVALASGCIGEDSGESHLDVHDDERPPIGGAPAEQSDILILGTSVTGDHDSLEARVAHAMGLTVRIVTAAEWGAMTTDEFASYRAIVIGDPDCADTPDFMAAAIQNRATWSPVVRGNVFFIATDPVHHQLDGGEEVTRRGIAFAAAAPAKTGLYLTTSCAFSTAPSGTPIEVLAELGTFTVGEQAGCPNDAHIIARHPALEGLTDAHLSGWNCSAHGGFESWPRNFEVLVIATNIPSPFRAPDGTSGAPFVLSRGAIPINCGNGTLEQPEECDDGNNSDSDGCDSSCNLEQGTNQAPVARCKDVTVAAGESCRACAAIDDGSFDPDGTPVAMSAMPACDYPVGETAVTLTVTDPQGASATCSAKVVVEDQGAPKITVKPLLLWPPNHKMHELRLSDCVAEATSACGGPIDVDTAGEILSIYSDEPEDSRGNGDGNTLQDIVIVGPSTFRVRAERNGCGNGRVYGIKFRVTKESGSTDATCFVGVPHDQSGAAPVDDGAGAGYTVTR